jgi:hypothetical protein
METKKSSMCPVMKGECLVECALFKDGECCIAFVPDLVEKLEDVVSSIETLEQTIRNKNFTE